MSENESFFRKVVRFVANPSTEWVDLSTRQEDAKELELEKSELKAMIERKRRNDFVRKREFDMLRRVRREGLSPEQLATLGTSSRLDDSEARLPDNQSRPDGVKAKIDEIEQQMVGDGFHGSNRGRSPGGYGAPAPEPAVLARNGSPNMNFRLSTPPPMPDLALPLATGAPVQMVSGLAPLSPHAAAASAVPSGRSATPPLRGNLPPVPPPLQSGPAAAPASASASDGLYGVNGAGHANGANHPNSPNGAMSDFGNPWAVEVNEVMHDPELDEAVIAFANADFTQCEEALQRITAAGGERAQHAETWLVLFDLYRATGQQQRFESLALEYAQQFGWSAPQWYSLPKLVADAVADEPLLTSSQARHGGEVGWICPDILDIEAVARLRSQTLQMPLPWVFDWGGLRSIDAEAAMQLSMVFRLWAGQSLEMRWMGGDKLFAVLQDAAPTGVRDADPAFWLTRLDALRLANRADGFDEAAIDYCVTYEVSPPSWEATRCKVHVSSGHLSTRNPPMSMVSDVSTSFLESGLTEDLGGGIEMAHVELSGQLIGDISATLNKLLAELGSAPVVSVSCARLIRVDFIAAGDLLNWVLARRNEARAVQFVDAHRLLALFFGAMGINEHAKVQVRKV